LSVLTPPDPIADDRRGEPTAAPRRSAVGRIRDLVDEQWRRSLVVVASLAGLGLLGGVVMTVGGSGDQSEDLSTASPSIVATSSVEASDADGGGDGAPVPADDRPQSPTVEAMETTAPEAVASSSSQPPTSPGPPTTSGPDDNGVVSTAGRSTVTSTTAVETTASTTATTSTAAPTTGATSTTRPTTASTTTTAAPTTPPPTTAATTTAPPGPGNGPVQQQILNLVNAERARVNCGALTLNGQLNTAAAGHSEDMAANGYFSHTGLDGSQPWDRARAAGYGSSSIGENIAQGYGSVEAVMNGWMNSSGHRANILNCGYQHLGVGLSSQGNYWTQLFGGG